MVMVDSARSQYMPIKILVVLRQQTVPDPREYTEETNRLLAELNGPIAKKPPSHCEIKQHDNDDGENARVP